MDRVRRLNTNKAAEQNCSAAFLILQQSKFNSVGGPHG